MLQRPVHLGRVGLCFCLALAVADPIQLCHTTCLLLSCRAVALLAPNVEKVLLKFLAFV